MRKWLWGYFLNRYSIPSEFIIHKPSYLNHLLPLKTERPRCKFPETSYQVPKTSIVIPLPGTKISIHPGEESTLFSRSYSDTEALLSLHRFAWIERLEAGPNPDWINLIWCAWKKKFRTVDKSWAWHPYTASERAINIINFALEFGLPKPVEGSLNFLAAHVPAILNRLEYFGDHYTSNHLANNGRALFIIGLELGMPKATEIGSKILVEEAKRIFLDSGILREGSTHYHLLLTKNFLSALKVAQKFQHPIKKELEVITKRALSAIPYLMLSAGIPLIGDISPDMPCKKLISDLGLCFDSVPVNLLLTNKDGWLRHKHKNWDGLWYSAPGGLPPMPGHGHQDSGSFEIHYSNERLFIDVGRGTYEQTTDAEFDVSALSHNSLTVDLKDPFPQNRPYYDEDFRKNIVGGEPILRSIERGVELEHYGYSRFKNVGKLSRNWMFTENSMMIRDKIDGKGKRVVSRTLCTTFDVIQTKGKVVLKKGTTMFYLTYSNVSDLKIERGTYWIDYGEARPVTRIKMLTRCTLPYSGNMMVEKK